MANFSISNAKVMDKDGKLVDIPSPGRLVPPVTADGDKVYHLSDLDIEMSWTIQLTPEEFERLQWVLGVHWLWVKYRRGLN